MTVEEIYNFAAGMQADLSAGLMSEGYRVATWSRLTSLRGVMALAPMKTWANANYLIDYTQAPFGYDSCIILSSYECKAGLGPNRQPTDALLLFRRANQGGAVHWIISAVLMRGQPKEFVLFRSDLRPQRERYQNDYFALADSLVTQPYDAAYFSAGDRHYVAFTTVSGMYLIDLFVANTATNDVSIAPHSGLAVPNEPDCLLLRPLYPCTPVYVQDVVEGGTLRCGTYEFAYRLYSTKQNRYSAWSLVSVPIHLNLPADTSNQFAGGGPGESSGKRLRLTISDHHHHAYYDSVQLAVIATNGSISRPEEIWITDPSREMYDSRILGFEYNGSEPGQSVLIDEVVSDDAPIIQAKTIIYTKGQIVLGGPIYLDESWSPSIGGAETIVQNVPGPIDTREDVPLSGPYAPLNQHRFAGYWRGELYRFYISIHDKFGGWSLARPIDFSPWQYDPLDHAGTWQLNHSTGKDWEFVSRSTAEGSLFYDEGFRHIGLRVSDVGDYPEWAFGMAVFRANRIPRILGQSPVVRGVPYCGGVFAKGYNDLALFSGDLINRDYWNSHGIWDYDGRLDYVGPAVICRPDTLPAVSLNGIVPYEQFAPTSGVFAEWRLTETADDVYTDLVWLYPPEYLLNQLGEPVFASFQARAIEAIDYVGLKRGSFNRSRIIGFSTASLRLFAGANNGFVYRVTSPNDYFSHAAPFQGAAIMAALSGHKSIVKKYFLDWGSPAISADRGHCFVAPGASERYAVSHIRRIEGGNDLVRSQNDQDLIALFGDAVFPESVTAQRAFVAAISHDGGPPYLPIDRLDGELALPLSNGNHFLPIVNILSGEGIDRYGDGETPREVYWTGAYQSIGWADSILTNPKTFDVWGGDAWIARAIISVRESALLSSSAPVKDEYDYSPDPPTTNPQSIVDQKSLVSSARRMIEMIDMWVESSVPCHFVIRSQGEYPYGLSGELANETQNLDEAWEHPAVRLPDLSRYFFQSNFSFSLPPKVLAAKDASVVFNRQRGRYHWSDQTTLNTLPLRLDRFLSRDFWDEEGMLGEVNAMELLGNDRLVAIHEHGAIIIYLGQSLAEDSEGFAVALSSGRFVGAARPIDIASSNMGDGVLSPRALVRTEAGLFALGRRGLFQIGEGKPSRIDFPAAWELLRYLTRVKDTQAEELDGGMTLAYNKQSGDLFVYRDTGLLFGLIFNTRIGKWTSIMETYGEDTLVGAAGFGDRGLMIWREGRISLDNGSNTPTGYPIEFASAYVEVVVGSKQNPDADKVVLVVQVETAGNAQPAGCAVVAWEDEATYTPDFEILDQNPTFRGGSWHFYNFVDAAGKRSRGRFVTVRVFLGNAAISSIKVKYRISTLS